MPNFLDSRFVRIYVVPGAVFQSMMVGGGYGTGREIVEYFTSFGLQGGLMAMGVAFVTLSAILALSFEFSRVAQAFDYRNFFKLLLGRGWVAFEVLIILQFLLVLAVLAAAAGSIVRDSFGIPYNIGLVFMLAIVAVLTFFGREVIIKTLTFWSAFLYVVFFTFFIAVLSAEPLQVSHELKQVGIVDGWSWSGFKYALYNLAAVPLMLYLARNFRRRAEALRSGVMAGAIAIIPALLFHLVFTGQFPELLDEPLPVYWVMAELGMGVFVLIYSVMLFGTFIETGAGMLQGIIERIDAYFLETRGCSLSRATHAGIAASGIALSTMLSMLGITSLIAQGYGSMAWGFLAVYVIPLATVGVYRLTKAVERPVEV